MAQKTNPKLQKQIDSRQRQNVDNHIKDSEKKETFNEIKTWQQHVEDRHVIAVFSTIIGDKIYYVEPKGNEIFLPFSEYFGDHSENWIVAFDTKTNEEVYRKNTRTTDMITWKLSSPKTNTENNG